AECHAGARHAWRIVRRGATLATAQAYANECIKRMGKSVYGGGPYIPAPPGIEPPPGYGYDLQLVTHDAPHENCACGIYAATDEATPREYLPLDRAVYGKVKLWGRVIPGSKGLRAEFAYPSEFHVPKGLADDPTLKAFGVPIVVEEAPPAVRGRTLIAVAPPAVRGRTLIAVALIWVGWASFVAALAWRVL
ncbi:MAG: hypothetical protein NUW01_10380, partial [Gemmatimonadaceae bacterium]|nr:hypothetical protein [Gemmatimonadaceae bacterium]